MRWSGLFWGGAMSDQPQGKNALDPCPICKDGKLVYQFRQVETAPKTEYLVLGQFYPTFRLVKNLLCNRCCLVFKAADESLSDETIFHRQLTSEFLKTHTLGLKDQDRIPHECPHCGGACIKRYYNAHAPIYRQEDIERKRVFNYCSACLSILSVLPARQLVCPVDENTRQKFAELYIKDFGDGSKT